MAQELISTTHRTKRRSCGHFLNPIISQQTFALSQNLPTKLPHPSIDITYSIPYNTLQQEPTSQSKLKQSTVSTPPSHRPHSKKKMGTRRRENIARNLASGAYGMPPESAPPGFGPPHGPTHGDLWPSNTTYGPRTRVDWINFLADHRHSRGGGGSRATGSRGCGSLGQPLRHNHHPQFPFWPPNRPFVPLTGVQPPPGAHARMEASMARGRQLLGTGRGGGINHNGWPMPPYPVFHNWSDDGIEAAMERVRQNLGYNPWEEHLGRLLGGRRGGGPPGGGPPRGSRPSRGGHRGSSERGRGSGRGTTSRGGGSTRGDGSAHPSGAAAGDPYESDEY